MTTKNVKEMAPPNNLVYFSALHDWDGTPVPYLVNHLAIFSFPDEALPLEICSNSNGLTGLILRVPEVRHAVWRNHVFCGGITLSMSCLELECIALDLSTTLQLASLDLSEDIGLQEEQTLPLLTVVAPVRTIRYIALGDPEGIPSAHTEDLAGDCAPWRWWSVVRHDAGPVEVREIPAWEGKRVRRYFRAADRARAESVEGTPLLVVVAYDERRRMALLDDFAELR
ncbi:hypothetical protein BD413DRAFT_611668 [Trametes elegans]|nr:hypothetical protein BD413DRAFT_611668 [Trametes elegans]